MNEELRIVIKAVTDSAKKAVNDVRKELKAVGVEAEGSSNKLGMAMKGMAKGAAIAVAAIAAVGAAVVALGKKSLETIKEQAKLIASFQAVGASAKTAETTYKGFYRFLGDKGKATEAAAHLAKIARNQEQLAEWTKISQGVYATFGDSLPIEGLTEAANETLRVGKVTGNLADALNWAGVSEDEFNAKLAQTNSYEEREALLRSTLNNLYGEAAEIYEKNNKALLDYNESQAKVDSALAQAGAIITPLLTSLNNLSATLLNALKPALEFIVPILSNVVNWLAQATQAVVNFFSALTGKSTSITAAAKNIGSAAGATSNLGSGMGQVEDNALGAADAIEKAKRAAMGFDELNIVSSGTTSSGADTSTTTTPTYSNNGGFVDNQVFSAEVEQVEGTTSKILDSIKGVFSEIATLFEPTKRAWTDAFATLRDSWNEAKPHFINGAIEIKDGFIDLVSYLGNEFVPNIVNSFSVELAPVITDVLGFALEETGKQFEWFGGVFKDVTNDFIIPALDSIENVTTDTFEVLGNTWDEFGDKLTTQASSVFENLRGHFDNFYNSMVKPVLDSVKKKFDEVWSNNIKPVFASFTESLAGIGEDIMIFYNQILAPIIDWIIAFVAPHVVDAFNDIMDVIGILWTFVGEVVAGITRTFEGFIGFIVGVFTGDWEKAWEGMKDYFGGIWDVIVSIFSNAWELIKKAFEPAIEFYRNIGTNIQKIFNTLCEWLPVIFERAWDAIVNVWGLVVRYFSEVWEGIKSSFKNAPDWLKNIFQTAWDGIKNAFSTAVSFFTGIWTGITNVFNNASNWFKSVFNAAWSNISTSFQNAKSFFQGKWTDIQNVFNGVGSWFQSKFTDAWTKIKNVFAPVGTFFGGIWNTIKDKFSSLGTSIGNAISSSVVSGINGIIGSIESIINDGIGLINGAIGIINKIPGVDISTISYLDLPRLAKGGIAQSATAAVIGEAGKEAVLPLENNTEWMDKLADRIASRTNTPSKIVLQIGEKELGWATISAINGITSQTGRLQLSL